MTNRILRNNMKGKIALAIVITIIYAVFLYVEIFLLKAFQSFDSFILDSVCIVAFTGHFAFFGLRNYIIFFGGVKIGKAKECLKAYEIDLDDLDEDMKNAKRIDNLYMGKKYFLCAGKAPLIMPIQRMIVVHPRTLVFYGEAFDSIDIYANAVTVYITDDTEKSRSFEMYKKKERRIEDRIAHFERIMQLFKDADPAILTPLEHAYFEWVNRFHESFDKAKEIVSKKREHDFFYTSC